MTGRTRANGEGSFYPVDDGFRGYVWVTTPSGRSRRKYVSGKNRDDVHARWITLQAEAKQGPVATSHPKVSEYLNGWMDEVIRPHRRLKTIDTYDRTVRLYLHPGLGEKRLNKLDVRTLREFFNKLAVTCQCCKQGKDAARPEKKQRCCAIGKCCEQRLSKRSVHDVRTVLRSALTNAVAEERISKNPAALMKLSPGRKTKVKPWSVEDARQFLVSAREADDPYYATYVLILVLGLRRGEALGLQWQGVDLDAGVLWPIHGLQRIGRRLVLDDLKTDASDDPLPLPSICVAALTHRKAQQAAHKLALDAKWPDKDGLCFTSRIGAPTDPRSFARAFNRRCVLAGVRRIRVQDTRHTCGSLLAAMDIHPRVAMQILRHSRISTTMEIYTHVPSEVTRQALKRLGASLDGLES
ncbi:tyrosine-type recombinase/integrase [Streptomyces sp. SID13031]|uniref:tyrosine-type recombinase/integrase n=1 Tax=Streptomyces sp. SID13031 TaxID=2706046 RepID=UPI0013C87EE7|nr:tyrosine-type recombinase/integrase [Streptomyces sp. SID13031]NEA37558.1 site-specific integrase [Streptomyces sp. SID13031]